MGKKIRKEQEIIHAADIFTDRVLPRDAFWKRYNKVKEEIECDQSEAHVLTFYGIGGIGKSSLLKKLEVELKEKVSEPCYVRIDFNDVYKTKDVLCSIRNTFVEKYKFKFSLFDFALYHYSQKIGVSMDAPEVKSIIENSELLNTTFSVLGMIPIAATAAQILQCTDKGIAIVANFFNEHKKESEEISRLEKEELEQCLPMFFAKDMRQNLKKVKEPCVIMLDTYEQLVNEMSAIGESLNNDLWLRGEKGLILNIPKVLWVVAGREKIKWDDILHEGWEDSLEQHNLGDLSETDSCNYLEKAGISDEKLRKELFELTHGTPIYLDICVQRYHEVKSGDVIPQITDFGQDKYTLIERFARYMDDNRKDLVYMLACLGKWTDEMVMTIIPAVYPVFSISLYDKVKGFSFITCNETKVYHFHKTVAEILAGNCPLEMKKSLYEKLMEFCRGKIMETSAFSDEYAFYMEQLENLWYVYSQMYGKADLRTTDVMEEIANAMQNANEYESALMMLNTIYGIRRDALGKANLDTIRVLHHAGLIYKNLGDLNNAFKCCNGAYELYLEACGEYDLLTLNAWRDSADILRLYGRNEDALKMYNHVYEKYLQLVGALHPDTMDVIYGMAAAFDNLGKYADALMLYKELYARYEKAFGAEDVKTIYALSYIASVLVKMNNCDEAIETYEELYQLAKKVFGMSNKGTIDAGFNKAVCMCMKGEIRESRKLMAELLEASKSFLGEDHPSTIRIAQMLEETASYENK